MNSHNLKIEEDDMDSAYISKRIDIFKLEFEENGKF